MPTTPTIRELARRVADRREGTRFVVPAPRESALEVFNHPFAHAAIAR